MSDPGMAIKMASPGLDDLDVWLAGGRGDESQVRVLIDFVDRRWDCADFRVITLLKLLYAAPALPKDLHADITAAVLGFRYWMDEPGEDSMCFWSENHQVIFFTCAYLAGQHLPTEIFRSSGVSGDELRTQAEARLRRWLAARFRFGYSEWTSTTYYEEDAAALAMLIDHAEDPALRDRAEIVMDLLFLDLALHHLDGRTVASSGRAYERQTKEPETADVNPLIRWGFGDSGHEFDLARMSGVVLTSGYRVPPALRAIAADERSVTLRTSAGLDLHEVVDEVGDPLDMESVGMQFWLQEAFSTPEAIEVTIKILREWNLEHNSFLAPLHSFTRLSGKRLLPGLVRLLNPATQGVAIQRADVVTYRSPHAQLSSAQRHHPGSFGDQQLIWLAGLAGDINVYGTHPAVPMFDGVERNFSPSEWVGNGIKPDVAQHDGVLLAVYDTTPRRGYLERGRRHLSHVYFPVSRFDETEATATYVLGRSRGGYIALLGAGRIQVESEDSFLQEGKITAWAVLVSGEHEMTYEEFRTMAQTSTVSRSGTITSLRTPEHTYHLRAGGSFRIDGRVIEQDHPRFDTPWVKADRFPTRLEIEADGHRLVLSEPDGERSLM